LPVGGFQVWRENQQWRGLQRFSIPQAEERDISASRILRGPKFEMRKRFSTPFRPF
jgi:hypothetical protein